MWTRWADTAAQHEKQRGRKRRGDVCSCRAAASRDLWLPSSVYAGGLQLLEQPGLLHTSTNHPSVAIVEQNSMCLWSVFIIMRMTISSIWLLPHKTLGVKDRLCPGGSRSVRNYTTLKRQYSELGILNARKFISALALFLCVCHYRYILRTNTLDETLASQKWLHDLIASFHDETFPGGYTRKRAFKKHDRSGSIVWQ